MAPRLWTTRSPSPRGSKYHAVHVFVTTDGTLFSRDDLVRVAAVKRVMTGRLVQHRVGPSTMQPLSLCALAAALGLSGDAFDSRLEAHRYLVLLREQAAGRIRDLRRQVPYPLHVLGGKCIATWRADFVYTRASGETVVEDTKGYVTKDFERTKKHVEAEYGLVVTVARNAENRLP